MYLLRLHNTRALRNNRMKFFSLTALVVRRNHALCNIAFCKRKFENYCFKGKILKGQTFPHRGLKSRISMSFYGAPNYFLLRIFFPIPTFFSDTNFFFRYQFIFSDTNFFFRHQLFFRYQLSFCDTNFLS